MRIKFYFCIFDDKKDFLLVHELKRWINGKLNATIIISQHVIKSEPLIFRAMHLFWLYIIHITRVCLIKQKLMYAEKNANTSKYIDFYVSFRLITLG